MRYAFASPPEQFKYIGKALPHIRLDGVHGLSNRWDVPFATWFAPGGLDTTYPASQHATVTLLHHRSTLTRMDRAGRGARGGGRAELIVYGGGYERQWLCRDDASCDQIYLSPGIIATCGEEVFGKAGIEIRDDRCFADDFLLRTSIESYIARGRDLVDLPTRLEMDARALLIAIRLVTRYSNGTTVRPGGARGMDERRLKAVMERIDAHLDDTLPVADLAAGVGLSASQFYASFRQAAGVSPHRYVMQRRIERAKHLLLGRSTLAAIALDCGFSSQQHLCTAFRRHVGASPQAWRNAHFAENAAEAALHS